MDTELIKYETVYKIVSDYIQAVDRIKSAYTLLFEAQELLKSICQYACVLPRSSLSNYDFKQVIDKVKSDAWKGILEKTKAREFMTDKRYNNFLRSLEKPEDIPDITLETVRGFVENLIKSAPDMLLEFIKETFNWLHPGIWSTNKYKTNEKSKYEIKEKIIRPGLFSPKWMGAMELSYYQEQNLRAMDSAFHLMDGKGIPKEGSAYFAIKEAEENNQMWTETNYFFFKWFRNGNLHIKFKRMDLVNKMNQIAGENLLKGEK